MSKFCFHCLSVALSVGSRADSWGLGLCSQDRQSERMKQVEDQSLTSLGGKAPATVHRYRSLPKGSIEA